MVAAMPDDTGGIVVFDYTAWATRYPVLAQAVAQDQAQAFFDQACLYLANTPAGPVRDLARRAVLLGLLVAHIATLELPQAQGGQAGLVGRVASATQGSVTVSTAYATLAERAAWFAQTAYGAAFWAATRGLRQARYVPDARRRMPPWG